MRSAGRCDFRFATVEKRSLCVRVECSPWRGRRTACNSTVTRTERQRDKDDTWVAPQASENSGSEHHVYTVQSSFISDLCSDGRSSLQPQRICGCSGNERREGEEDSPCFAVDEAEGLSLVNDRAETQRDSELTGSWRECVCVCVAEHALAERWGLL